MTITLRTRPEDKLIELGGGGNPIIRPNCDVRPCQDAEGRPTVDFTADFNEPLPIQSREWDGVFSRFVLEHISWRKVRQFISEVHRILKPGGKAVLVTANTEAQLDWIKNHPEGWDGRDAFDSCSCILFGDLDYPENSHKNFLSPTIAIKLFHDAGFDRVTVQPYGQIATDMCIEAYRGGEEAKPEELVPPTAVVMTGDNAGQVMGNKEYGTYTPNVVGSNVQKSTPSPLPNIPREQLFDHAYFDGGTKVGGYAGEGYRDFPCHEVTARMVMVRRPESVLELGCGRGYVLKRLEDSGIVVTGLDISKHAYMTRVVEDVHNADVADYLKSISAKTWDLCFSMNFLEHVPEDLLPGVITEMERICQRGLHGITFAGRSDGFDRTQVTLKPREWWMERLPKSHEVLDKDALERGDIPVDVLQGDGKVKLNIGSYTTMYHHGWQNVDIHDLTQFAVANRYQFTRSDVHTGLHQWKTGEVDLIMACHFLEHLNYREGLAFLRDCRRVLKSGGAMRIIVPDAEMLLGYYADGSKSLQDFDHVNVGCAEASTSARKLWAVLNEGHSAVYDGETLTDLLAEAGFNAAVTEFRSIATAVPPSHQRASQQILCESLDLLPCLSLYVDAWPSVG